MTVSSASSSMAWAAASTAPPREDGYDITVASEIMAVLCLASDITDLKARLSRLVVGYTLRREARHRR